MSTDIQVRTDMTINFHVTVPVGLLVLEHAGEDWTVRSFDVRLRNLDAGYEFVRFRGSIGRKNPTDGWSARVGDIAVDVHDPAALWEFLPDRVQRRIRDSHDWLDRRIPPLVLTAAV